MKRDVCVGRLLAACPISGLFTTSLSEVHLMLQNWKIKTKFVIAIAILGAISLGGLYMSPASLVPPTIPMPIF